MSSNQNRWLMIVGRDEFSLFVDSRDVEQEIFVKSSSKFDDATTSWGGVGERCELFRHRPKVLGLKFTNFCGSFDSVVSFNTFSAWKNLEILLPPFQIEVQEMVPTNPWSKVQLSGGKFPMLPLLRDPWDRWIMILWGFCMVLWLSFLPKALSINPRNFGDGERIHVVHRDVWFLPIHGWSPNVVPVWTESKSGHVKAMPFPVYTPQPGEISTIDGEIVFQTLINYQPASFPSNPMKSHSVPLSHSHISQYIRRVPKIWLPQSNLGWCWGHFGEPSEAKKS